MDSPEERQECIDRLLDGRTIGSGLKFGEYPQLTVKDVALHDACRAYVAGLFLSTVLAAYAACEISLVDRLMMHLAMPSGSQVGFDQQVFDANWKSAISRVRELRSLEKILSLCIDSGYWIGGDIQDRLRLLSSHKNDLAHFREWGEAKFVSTGPTSVSGTFSQSPLIDPAIQRSYADHAIETMLVFWSAPSASFTPGHLPPDDWYL